ncbi:MAG: DUF5106 domain-containing protein [Muribaculaceae bacterium]|nr:DUF5106 domain-containing protein [Muribaculaceae bacterium]
MDKRKKLTHRMAIVMLAVGMAAVGHALPARAESELIYVAPLFEYPIAPEELPDLQTKSDWLMEHFWDSFNFKSTTNVDQNALNDAFGVYSAAMMYASRAKALASVENIVKSIKGNPAMTLQFAKAAEEAFYGPRAIGWSDEVYIPFLKAVIADKKLSDTRKARYVAQYDNIKANAIGAKFPKLRMTLRDGRHQDFQPSTDYTIVEIGNPDCDDCRFARMKLEMASDLKTMVEEKRLTISFIVADAVPEEESDILTLLSDYPAAWITGISYGADDKLDIRQTPTFYVLGKKGEILAKNLDVAGAVDMIRSITGK